MPSSQLPRAQLDQRLALADQLERLIERGLAGVEPADDLLHARGGLLIALRLWPALLRVGLAASAPLGHTVRAGQAVDLALSGAHRSVIRAPSKPSLKRSRTSPAARACAALISGSP